MPISASKRVRALRQGNEILITREDWVLPKNPRLLLAGKTAAVLFTAKGNAIAWSGTFSFAASGAGQRLAKTAGTGPIVVLDNGADTQFREQGKVPEMKPADMPQYFTERFANAFKTETLNAGMEETPDRYLLAGTNLTPALDEVFAGLRAAGADPGFLAIAPVEAAGLAAHLAARTFKNPARWAVFAGRLETGGLRIVVARDGNFVLTMLGDLPDNADGATFAKELRAQVDALQVYLARRGYKAEEGMDVIAICGEDDKKFFDAKKPEARNFRCLTLAEGFSSLGMTVEGNSGDVADALFAACAVLRGGILLPLPMKSFARPNAKGAGGSLWKKMTGG
jgi:hypothetical protein